MKKSFNLTFIFGFILIFSAVFQPMAHAQISRYQRLSLRYNRPHLYLTTFSLPDQSPYSVQLITAFKINYPMLSFKKLDEFGSQKFYATPFLRIQLFKSPQKDLSFKEQISIVGLEAVAGKTWRDSVFAKSYEATQKASNLAVGFMQIPLPAGRYTFIIEFGGSSPSTRTSGTRNIKVNSYSIGSSGEIIFAGSVRKQDDDPRLNLLNMGSNVIFSENFYALIHLPNFAPQKNYILRVYRIKASRNDTARIETVFNKKLSNKHLIKNVIPELHEKKDELYLDLHQNKEGYAFALVQVPNRRYKEATYKIAVIEAGTNQTVAQKVYRSVWFDKPVSLYNVDVAIEMLRFIANEKTIEQIESGSAAAERAKLNKFWEKRDPTPNTEFNELKAEYYRRIDYAFEHFGSPRNPGFNTDRGRIYILYGPPDNIERVFPAEGQSREIWSYGERQFVFEATSGYGDYVLIERR